MPLLLNLVTQLFRTVRHKEKCIVCNGASYPHATVDFNKSCEEARGKYLPPTGISILYFLCTRCGFCFAPEIARWNLAQFEEHIYNENYVLVDPDYVETRPRTNAENLMAIFGTSGLSLKHLDYGGGSGLLSNHLRQFGWNSLSYDPFVDRDKHTNEIGKFDLITAFEVFEHVPNPRKLMMELSSLANEDSIIFFSTLLSDGHILPGDQLTWWYASPRNGHISLFSSQSLAILAKESGFLIKSLSEGVHCMWRGNPAWGGHILSSNP